MSSIRAVLVVKLKLLCSRVSGSVKNCLKKIHLEMYIEAVLKEIFQHLDSGGFGRISKAEFKQGTLKNWKLIESLGVYQEESALSINDTSPFGDDIVRRGFPISFGYNSYYFI